MIKKIFNIEINASKELVWDTLWSDVTYRQWTAVFSPDSHAISDWKEGSKIQFIDNTGDGMHSIIEKKIQYQQMSFKHLGEIKNGIESISDWAGSMEEYFLKEEKGITYLSVKMDIVPEFEEYFSETFPKAMEILKQLSEKQ